jgi:hypothetical protein
MISGRRKRPYVDGCAARSAHNERWTFRLLTTNDADDCALDGIEREITFKNAFAFLR